MTSHQDSLYCKFFQVMLGVKAPYVAQALGEQTPGIDWTGSTKKSMANHYAGDFVHLAKKVIKVDLYKLRMRACELERAAKAVSEERKKRKTVERFMR